MPNPPDVVSFHKRLHREGRFGDYRVRRTELVCQGMKKLDAIRALMLEFPPTDSEVPPVKAVLVERKFPWEEGYSEELELRGGVRAAHVDTRDKTVVEVKRDADAEVENFEIQQRKALLKSEMKALGKELRAESRTVSAGSGDAPGEIQSYRRVRFSELESKEVRKDFWVDRESPSPLEEIQWVFQHISLDASELDPRDAPSSGAWGLLLWALERDGNRLKLNEMWSRSFKGSSSDLGDEEFFDDGRANELLTDSLSAIAKD